MFVKTGDKQNKNCRKGVKVDVYIIYHKLLTDKF